MAGRRGSGTTKLRWAGRLCAEAAAARHRELADALVSSRRVEIVFGEVAAVDVTHLQLLLAAREAAVTAGVELAVPGGVPAQVLEAAATAGIPAAALPGRPPRTPVSPEE